MAHEMSEVSGRVEMFWYKYRPWHTLGHEIPERITGKEAIAAAGLGWPVEPYPVFFRAADGSFQEIDGFVANARVDRFDVLPVGIHGSFDSQVGDQWVRETPLGIVSKDYRIFQNADLAGLLDAIVGEGAAVYETGGAIRGGRQIFFTLRLPDEVVMGNDRIQKYLVLVAGHDGVTGVRIFWTPIKVVCANTLRMALRGADAAAKGSGASGFSTSHTGNVREKIAAAREALELGNLYFDRLAGTFHRLVDFEMSPERADRYVGGVLRTAWEIEDGAAFSPTVERARETILRHFHEDAVGEGLGFTVWGAFNAVVKWNDHTRHIKMDGSPKKVSPEARFQANLTGGRMNVKQIAYDRAMQVVGAR